MSPLRFFFFCLFIVLLLPLKAQESGLEDSGKNEDINWDIDSLFDAPPEDDAEPEDEARTGFAGALRQSGFSLDASFYAYGGITPGWSEAPWFWSREEEQYSHVLGIIMDGSLGLDFQLSDILRIKNSFGYRFPGFEFRLHEFFLDYNLKDMVFFRAGKYTHNWGISTNYPFTNLLARLPPGNAGGDSYVFKVNIPIGIGGIELLALTRDGFIADLSAPAIREIGFGGKYNLAFRRADIDLGIYYHRTMPLRALVSVKSTIRNTEVYAEALVSIRHETWDDLKGSANAGFLHDFFADKLTVNGEIFYNGEHDTLWFNPENKLQEADISPFIEGFNAAFNLMYRPRPGDWGDLRLFSRCLYSFDEKTAYLVPGFSLSPFSHITVYLAVPTALGSREGTYYTKNADTKNRPFSIVFLVSLNGSYHFGYYAP